jgi:hypothetical protein
MTETEVVGNQKTILSNQQSIMDNQKTILSNQSTIEKNQKSLDEILANQKEILAAPRGSAARRTFHRPARALFRVAPPLPGDSAHSQRENIARPFVCLNWAKIALIDNTKV